MRVYKQPKIKGMKVRWKEKSEFLRFEHNQVVDVISVERGWYRVIDGSGEDYLYPPECFEIVERQPIKTDFKPLLGKKILILTGDSDLYRGDLDTYAESAGDKQDSSIVLTNVTHRGEPIDEPMTFKLSDIANVEEVIWKIKKTKKSV